MLNTHRMPIRKGSSKPQPLLSSQFSKCVINLRGNSEDPAFLQAVQEALNLPLPVKACSTIANPKFRLVWAGPDDWFVIGPQGEQQGLLQRLCDSLKGLHCAVTDVSSGYFQVSLSGAQARDTLSQGCPMDFHPSVFKPGQAVGTHFFKVGLYLWLRDDAPTFEMLVRRSFIDHFWQLIEHCSTDCGWVTLHSA